MTDIQALFFTQKIKTFDIFDMIMYYNNILNYMRVQIRALPENVFTSAWCRD